MTVYLVGGGPGDPGLLTRRGAEVLGRADVVLYDRLSASALLDLAPARAERINVGKTPGHPSIPQDEINTLLVEHGRSAATVVRLKGGDPFVFGRGGEEAAALAEAGVPFEVVPGVPAAVAVPAYAGIPITHRGVATSFTVVTGQNAPWASTGTDWGAVARLGGTILLYMSAAVRGDIAEQLMAGGLSPSTAVAAVTWGTVPAQRTIRTTLGELGAVPVEAPAVIVIGDVAGFDLAWFERRALFGRTVVVTRASEQAGALTAALTAAGAAVIEVPTIAIDDPEDGGDALRAAAANASEYDWVAFTSSNAVTRFMRCLRDARGLGSARVAAVGRATADALARHGVAADLTPSEFGGAALGDAFPAGPGRVLLPRAAGARQEVHDALVAKGWYVDGVEAYRTAAVRPPDGVLAEAAAADAITFMSPSAVDAWVDVAGVASTPVVACIGPSTATAARDRGLEVGAVGDPHTVDGLVDALTAVLAGTERPDRP